jgi:hypothetical protein
MIIGAGILLLLLGGWLLVRARNGVGRHRA